MGITRFVTLPKLTKLITTEEPMMTRAKLNRLNMLSWLLAIAGGTTALATTCTYGDPTVGACTQFRVTCRMIENHGGTHGSLSTCQYYYCSSEICPTDPSSSARKLRTKRFGWNASLGDCDEAKWDVYDTHDVDSG